MTISRFGSLVAGACALGFFVSSPASATPSACDGVAGNVIQNCGFESGDNSHWGLVNAPIGSDQFATTSAAHTGSFGWAIGATDPTAPNWDIIYQVFATTPGQRYDVSYFLGTDGTPPGEGKVNLFFDGYEQFPFLPNTGVTANVFFDPGSAFVEEKYSFVATGPLSLVYFGGWDQFGFEFMDDVVVRNAPEPFTLSLVGAGLAGVVAMRRRKKNSI
jgi:hypothetical protein